MTQKQLLAARRLLEFSNETIPATLQKHLVDYKLRLVLFSKLFDISFDELNVLFKKNSVHSFQIVGNSKTKELTKYSRQYECSEINGFANSVLTYWKYYAMDIPDCESIQYSYLFDNINIVSDSFYYQDEVDIDFEKTVAEYFDDGEEDIGCQYILALFLKAYLEGKDISHYTSHEFIEKHQDFFDTCEDHFHIFLESFLLFFELEEESVDSRILLEYVLEVILTTYTSAISLNWYSSLLIHEYLEWDKSVCCGMDQDILDLLEQCISILKQPFGKHELYGFGKPFILNSKSNGFNIFFIEGTLSSDVVDKSFLEQHETLKDNLSFLGGSLPFMISLYLSEKCCMLLNDKYHFSKTIPSAQ